MRRKLLGMTATAIGCILILEQFQLLPDPRTGLEQAVGTERRFTAEILQVEKKENDYYRICCSIDGEKVLCNYYAELDSPWSLPGSRIEFTGTLERPRGAGNPRTFDYAIYLKSEGIFFTAVISKMRVLQQEQSLFGILRNKVLTAREDFLIGLSLPEKEAGLVRGMLFGDTNSLSDEVYDDFRRNGTAHVLAVSGLHVGMLYGIYKAVYRKYRNPAWTVLLVCFLLLYGTAALWSVSVTRAVFLILLALMGDLLHRRYDLLTALAAAALAEIVQNPYVIFGAGFQMSFLAVLSMGFFMPVLAKKIGDTLAAAAAVQIGLMPYIAHTFNYVSLGGFFCNFPVVFLVSILVPSGVCGFFFFLMTGLCLPLLSPLLGGLAAMIEKINGMFASVSFFTFDMVSLPLWLTWGVYLISFFLASEYFQVLWIRKDLIKLRFSAVLIAGGICCAALAGMSPFDRADLIFLDVGQGDSLHIKGAKGTDILIDGGGNINYDVGEKTLKPYLLKNRVRSLDLAAATHLHTDHFLGISQLASCYPVKEILTEAKAGDRIRIKENQWIDVLWPLEENPETEDENLNSLIFKVYINDITVLITGDITEEGERMLLQTYKDTRVLQADILKVAHHGSAYSTCADFIEAVQPKVAVISVGKNRYGHPSHKVIEKLEKKGIMVFRTDRDGAVGIRKQRGKIKICTENP